jgi:hypothetical protein
MRLAHVTVKEEPAEQQPEVATGKWRSKFSEPREDVAEHATLERKPVDVCCLPPPLHSPPVRIFLAALLLAGALGGAVWLHGHRVLRHYDCGYSEPCGIRRHPSWADPAAIALAVVGFGAAGGIISAGRRKRDSASP